MSEAHCNNLAQRKALGLVTHDNTGGPFVIECHGCGSVYPSFQCSGGGQIADTGDYDDARCPHCQHVDPEECGNVGLAWNTQQLKINALQLLLNERDEQNHSLEQRRYAEQHACQAGERRVEELQATLKDLVSAVRSINRSPAYKVTVIGDDEPQYRQRKEWIDWVLELCDKASAGIDQPVPVAVDTHKEDLAHDTGYRNGVMHGYKLAVEGSEDDYQKCVSRLTSEINAGRRDGKTALAAVVLPEHRDSDLRSPTYGFARGWNTCLDEVARLNPIKQ